MEAMTDFEPSANERGFRLYAMTDQSGIAVRRDGQRLKALSVYW